MGKKLSIGVSDVAHKAKKAWIGVSDVAHKAKKAWIGDANGKARLFWSGYLAKFVGLIDYAYQQTYYNLGFRVENPLTGLITKGNSVFQEYNSQTVTGIHTSGKYIMTNHYNTLYSTDGVTWTKWTPDSQAGIVAYSNSGKKYIYYNGVPYILSVHGGSSGGPGGWGSSYALYAAKVTGDFSNPVSAYDTFNIMYRMESGSTVSNGITHAMYLSSCCAKDNYIYFIADKYDGSSSSFSVNYSLVRINPTTANSSESKLINFHTISNVSNVTDKGNFRIYSVSDGLLIHCGNTFFKYDITSNTATKLVTFDSDYHAVRVSEDTFVVLPSSYNLQTKVYQYKNGAMTLIKTFATPTSDTVIRNAMCDDLSKMIGVDGILYFVYQKADSNTSIYYSLDYGETWTSVVTSTSISLSGNSYYAKLLIDEENSIGYYRS